MWWKIGLATVIRGDLDYYTLEMQHGRMIIYAVVIIPNSLVHLLLPASLCSLIFCFLFNSGMDTSEPEYVQFQILVMAA